jgi:hypothetical protein
MYDSGQKNTSPQPFAAQNRAIIHPKKNLFLKKAKDRSSQPKPNLNSTTNTLPHSPKSTKPNPPPQTQPPTRTQPEPNFTKLTNPTFDPTPNPTQSHNHNPKPPTDPNQTYTTFTNTNNSITKNFHSKFCSTGNVLIPKK